MTAPRAEGFTRGSANQANTGNRAKGCVMSALWMACTCWHLATVAQPANNPANGEDAEALYEAAGLATHWGDFAEAERLFKATQTPMPPRRTASGQLTSTALQDGFENGLQNGKGLRVRQAEQTVAMTKGWVQQHPNSALAHGLHMKALTNLAWAYRGHGYANTVAPQAWGQFNATLDLATRHAAQHTEVLLSDSLGYRSLLNLSRGAGWPAARNKAVYEQGIARFPHDDALHFAQLTNVLPKWGGDARGVDQHIEAATKQSEATFGLGLYAWLYTEAAKAQFEHALFRDSMASWQRMDQGFQDLTARYPHPQHFNAWSWMACQAQERQRLLELLEKIAPQPDLEQWGSNPQQTYDTCKAWAQKL